jgi:hypothetical protein
MARKLGKSRIARLDILRASLLLSVPLVRLPEQICRITGITSVISSSTANFGCAATASTLKLVGLLWPRVWPMETFHGDQVSLTVKYGQVWEIGLNCYGVGRPPSDKWKNVLQGQILAPVATRMPLAPSSPSRVYFG